MEKNNKHTSPRAGEYNAFSVRSNRYFEQKSYWYFRTREGMDIGPFDSNKEAQEGVNGFIGFLKEAHDDVVVKINKYVRRQPRQEEAEVTGSRTDRIFEQSHYWYFRTREGMDIGPFDSRGEAAIGVKGFVSFLEESQPEVVSRVTSYIRAV